MSIDDAKERAKAAVAAARDELTEVSLEIHRHPELAMKEERASKLLADHLEAREWAVERGAFGVPTAFRATWGQGPVTIAYLLEYDALPEIGHACGHNLIATAGLGGAYGAQAALDPAQVKVIVLGTPAEEDIGGKAIMIDRGAFEGVDAALMAHPAPLEIADPPMYGVESAVVTYHGRGAHAAMAPETAINALDAIVIAYQGMSQLRHHIRRDSRMNGVILEGGEASNVIPHRTMGRFEVRALQPVYLEELKKRLEGCFRAGADATGCTVDVQWGHFKYAPMNNNRPVAMAYKANAEALGRKFLPIPPESTGSSDMGNVSWVVPGIHPTFQVGMFALNHTAGFTDASATDSAHDNMIQVAQALAMTGVDLVLRPELLAEAKAAFTASR